MFVDDYFLGGNEHEHDFDFNEGYQLVALWDALDANTTSPSSYFLIEFHDQLILDTNYVDTNSETEFTLSMEGIYKITLNMLLLDLSANRLLYDIFATKWNTNRKF